MLGLKQFINKNTLSEGGQGGLNYEQKIFDAMLNYQKAKPMFFGIGASDKPVEVAGFSSQGAGDIEAVLDNNKPFNIEVKMDAKAQLGSGRLYVPSGKPSYAHPDFIKKTEADDLALILKAVDDKSYRTNVKKYLEKLASLRPFKSEISGVKFTTAEINIYKKYNNYIQLGLMGKQAIPHLASIVLKKDGLQAKIATKVELDARAISKLYNAKGVYYIQIGGSGLYYLGKDTLKLGVPPFTGQINVEIRVKPDGDSGGYSTSKRFTNAMRQAGGQDFVNKLLVAQDTLLQSNMISGKELSNYINAVSKNKPSKQHPYTGDIPLKYPTGILQARTRPMMGSGRFSGKLTKSDYTLDSIEGLQKIFGAI